MKKEYNFKKLKKAEPKYLKRIKEPVTIRLDPAVIAYFKDLAEKTDLPYQTLVNYVLRDYALHGLSPTANWESAKNKKSRA